MVPEVPCLTTKFYCPKFSTKTKKNANDNNNYRKDTKNNSTNNHDKPNLASMKTNDDNESQSKEHQDEVSETQWFLFQKHIALTTLSDKLDLNDVYC